MKPRTSAAVLGIDGVAAVADAIAADTFVSVAFLLSAAHLSFWLRETRG